MICLARRGDGISGGGQRVSNPLLGAGVFRLDLPLEVIGIARSPLIQRERLFTCVLNGVIPPHLAAVTFIWNVEIAVIFDGYKLSVIQDNVGNKD